MWAAHGRVWSGAPASSALSRDPLRSRLSRCISPCEPSASARGRGLTRSNRLHELTVSFQAGHSCPRRGFALRFFSVCRVAPRRVLGTWRGSEDPRWPVQGPMTLGI